MQPLISEPSHVVFELFSHRKCLDSTYFAWNSMHQRYWLVVYQTHFHFFTVTFSDLPCNRWGHVDESDEHQPLSGPTQQNISWSSTFLWQTEEKKNSRRTWSPLWQQCYKKEEPGFGIIPSKTTYQTPMLNYCISQHSIGIILSHWDLGAGHWSLQL